MKIKFKLEINSNEPDSVEDSSADSSLGYSTDKSVKDEADKADKSQVVLNSETLLWNKKKQWFQMVWIKTIGTWNIINLIVQSLIEYLAKNYYLNVWLMLELSLLDCFYKSLLLWKFLNRPCFMFRKVTIH